MMRPTKVVLMALINLAIANYREKYGFFSLKLGKNQYGDKSTEGGTDRQSDL